MIPISKILLIDAHAICYRAFYAVKELRNSKGQPTNAVFGFANILKKLLAVYAPTHVVACFDVGRKTKRQEKFSAYKEQRAAMPEDLSAQIPVIKEMLHLFNILMLECEGYEADDVIATLVARFQGEGHELIIASDDKDMHQLLGPGVRIHNSRRDALLGPEDTLTRFGVPSFRIVDYLALAGDASDNIPGVAGVGEVTACKLINTYGTLDDILANVSSLQGKLRERMEKGREAALLSRELATLDRAVPVESSLVDFIWPGPNYAGLRAFFAELEFRGLMAQMPKEDSAGLSLEAEKTAVVLVRSSAEEILKKVHATGKMALCLKDTEIAVAAGGGVFQGPIGSIDVFRVVLMSRDVLKILYDGKDVRWRLVAHEISIEGFVFDVLLAGYLVNAGRSAFTLESLSWGLLARSLTDEDRLAEEADVLAQLLEPLQAVLLRDGLQRLFQDIELPLSQVLFKMEREGVALDIPFLAGLSRDSEQRILEMKEQLFRLANEEFNLNSPRQLAHILFEKMQLPTGKKTKTGFSTDEEELTRLASQHELPALIVAYRQLAKLKSTYIDALPKLIRPETGRVHCSFNQAVAETGRLSSSHPNLQNIPIRTLEGRAIRKAFIPELSTHRLLSADYSQIELRVLAHLADEPNLKKAFADGEDIHSFTAALMFEVPLTDVTETMRYSAKRINFGIVYGMSAFGLAKDLGVAQREAQAFIERYFARYPGIRRFMDQEIAKARNQGYVETLFLRRRYIPEINSRNQGLRQFAERQAINMPVQGTAADLIKIAMVRVDQVIRERGFRGRMIISVHDELVFEVPVDELNLMAEAVVQTMETAVLLSVPVTVTAKSGLNWAEMKAL